MGAGNAGARRHMEKGVSRLLGEFWGGGIGVRGWEVVRKEGTGTRKQRMRITEGEDQEARE